MRTGYGGGYMDRQDVEYIARDDDDEEFDEFGRKKKKKKLDTEGTNNHIFKPDLENEEDVSFLMFKFFELKQINF